MITLLTGRMARPLSMDICRRLGGHIERGERALLLVPEQQTLLAENMLIQENALPGLFDAEVLSLRRLSQRVMKMTGSRREDVLDAPGRALLLARILDEIAPDLEVYRAVRREAGFIARLSGQIEEFRQNGVEPGDIAEIAGDAPGRMGAKLRDIGWIYGRYQAEIQGKYCDAEDMFAEFLAGIPECGFLRAHIYLDGFEYITPQLSELLLALAPCADSLLISQICAGRDRDAALFSHVTRSMSAFTDKARAVGQEVHQDTCVIPDDRPRELRTLNAELFALPKRPLEGKPDNIEILEAPNPMAEAEMIASRIEENLRLGEKPGDIGLLCGDMEGLGLLIARVCEQRGIPCWLDRREDIVYHGAVRYLRAALSCALWDFPRREALMALRSGYAGAGREAADRFENYAVACGVQGYLFTRPFRRGKEAERLAAEEIRKSFLPPLMALHRRLKNMESVRDFVLAIEELLEESGIARRLTESPARLDAETLHKSNFGVQVWNTICTALGRMLALLADLPPDPKRLSELLMSALDAATLGALPPAKNRVIISSPGHLKEDKDVLFFCGLSDAMFKVQPTGLLREEERALCAEKSGRYFGMTSAQALGRKQLDAYIALGRARKKLIISHSLLDLAGKSARKSPLIDYIRRALPGLHPEKPYQNNPERLITSRAAGFDVWVQLMGRTDSPLKEALGAYYRDSPDFALRFAAVSGERAETRAEKLPDAVRPFHLDTISASRLETFARCPYQHFVKYGLAPEIIRPWEDVDVLDKGEYYHALLEGYAREMLARGVDFSRLRREESDALIESLSREYMEGIGEHALKDTAMARALLQFMENRARQAAWLVARQWGRSRFRALEGEMVFGARDIPIAEGQIAQLRGKIDRVDILDSLEAVLITDYKSGGKTLSLQDVHEGIALQLPLYLMAAMDFLYPGRKARPAGMLYMPIARGSVEALSGESAEAEWEKANRPKGFLLRDESIVEALSDAPEMMGIRFNKDGTLRKDNALLEPADMNALLRHAKKRAGELARNIASGNVAAKPLRLNSQMTACSHCDFSAVCGFDASRESARDKEWPSSAKDALEMLRGEEL